MATGHQLDFLLTMKYGKWMIFLKLVLVRRSNNLLSWSLFSSGHVLWLVSASSHFGHHSLPKDQGLNHFFSSESCFYTQSFSSIISQYPLFEISKWLGRGNWMAVFIAYIISHFDMDIIDQSPVTLCTLVHFETMSWHA